MTSLLTQLDEAAVVVCTGPGGAGKTTVSGALAVALAELGRRVALVTIDPAKRLADALGLAALTNEPSQVRMPRTVSGSVDALMLDTKSTFDALVERTATSSKQAERILSNRFYRNIAGSLGGTQEYMASEKVYELSTSKRYDVIVLDTPPTKNALDFLGAPERIVRLLDNRLFKAMSKPSRSLVGMTTQVALKGLGRVVGSEVIADTAAFFQAFDGMEDGFRSRANAVSALLRSDGARWLVVTSPRTSTVAEACGLHHDLVRLGVTPTAAVANRVQPSFDPLPKTVPDALRNALRRARTANELAHAHREALAPLALLLPVHEIALRSTDVHDLAGLRDLATDLS